MVEEGPPDRAADAAQAHGRRTGGAPPEGPGAGAARIHGAPREDGGTVGAQPSGAQPAATRPAGLPRKPTLKTIAALTGLAVPTVSRALGDAPDLRADTKALVRRVAAELGYVPNRAGVRLRTGRTNVIALVMSTETEMMNHTARLISSVAAALQGTQFHLNVTPVFPSDDPLKPIRHIVETGLADAVIFNQTRPRDARVAWLLERGFPFATHGRTDWGDRHAWFDFDNGAFAAIGVRRLAGRGRRRIALLAPPLAQTYAVHIVAGATGAAPPGVEVRLVEGATGDDDHTTMREALALALDRGADGVLSASPTGAMAAVAALEAQGLTLGREADVVAKEAIPFLSLFRPGIVALREDVGRAGEALGRAAMQAIRFPGAPPLQELDVPADDLTHDTGAPP